MEVEEVPPRPAQRSDALVRTLKVNLGTIRFRVFTACTCFGETQNKSSMDFYPCG